MIIKNILDVYAASSARIFKTDRSQTIGASDVGQCARRVFWSKNEGDPKYGAERDPDYLDRWGAKVRGTIIENAFWEPAMRLTYGDRLLFAGAEQKTFVSGFLSATPDGLITGLRPGKIAPGSGTEVMAECKSADPRTNLLEAKAENIFQTQVQMGLVRELTKFQPTHSILSYIDASFWDEVAEFIVPFDQAIYDVAKVRAAQIMTATSAKDLKPEGWIAGGKECEHCPFTHACGIERRSVPKTSAEVDPQFAAEIAEMAIHAQRLKKMSASTDKLLRTVQDDIKNRLRDKGVKKLPGIVSWTDVKGRSGYDMKALQAAAIEAGIDIEQFSTAGEPTDRLTISIYEMENIQASA
jgi:hypothetical protein